jgi:hypothetical protein
MEGEMEGGGRERENDSLLLGRATSLVVPQQSSVQSFGRFVSQYRTGAAKVFFSLYVPQLCFILFLFTIA